MSIERYMQQAMEAYQAKDFRKARKLYEKVLQQRPEHLDANYLLGTVFAQMGKRQKAFEHLGKAARLNPDSAMIQTNLGILYQQAGELGPAESHFRRALQIDPALFQAHFNLAIVQQQQQRTADAATSLAAALSLKANFYPAQLMMAQLQKRSGNLTAAKNHAEKAAQLQPDSVEALVLLANIHAQAGQLGKAREIYQRLGKLAPGNANLDYIRRVLEGETPEQPPRAHFEEIFNEMSGAFDQQLAHLGYRGPQLLAGLLDACGLADQRYARMLDIGCGTGAAGSVFAPRTDFRLGIDIAARMLDHCRQKGDYQQLMQADIADLPPTLAPFDLVIAADVFPYTGELNSTTGAIARRLTAQGLLLFTTERSDHPSGFCIDPASGRYQFSDAYVESVAQQQGFDVLVMEIQPLRQEKGAWLQGHYCLWQKRPTNQ